jgi:hypothetical protein
MHGGRGCIAPNQEHQMGVTILFNKQAAHVFYADLTGAWESMKSYTKSVQAHNGALMIRIESMADASLPHARQTRTAGIQLVNFRRANKLEELKRFC